VGAQSIHARLDELRDRRDLAHSWRFYGAVWRPRVKLSPLLPVFGLVDPVTRL